ncbi:chemotaxis protein CheA [Marispirochaeta aestuarii]|uniref:chemotaxis protein CheA n=1 Tax=Marispirochaeta aestuarii TaxID=1963862 RepID=UPI002ABDAE0F|nr:chemotaxis protein CheA [Marispirochaeta aestuarii]
MDKRFIETFIEESYELLDSMEKELLALEAEPDDEGHIQAVFRAAHTIKGSAAMFGFQEISDFAHAFETVLDEVRSGTLKINRELMNLSLQGKDHLLDLLDATRNNETGAVNAALKEKGTTILKELSRISGMEREPEDKEAPPVSSTTAGGTGLEKEEATYRISFKPRSDIFASGANPLLLIRELHDLGKVTVFANIAEVPRLSEINPETLYLGWEILLTGGCDYNELRDVFIFVESESDIIIQELKSSDYIDSRGEPKRLGEILVDSGILDPKELKSLLESQKLIGQRIEDAGLADKSEIESALHVQEHFKKSRTQNQTQQVSNTLRVSSQRLDQLIDLVGELVTVQARLGQISAQMEEENLLTVSEELERLIDDLRDNAMSLRMLPIGSTFSQFRRMVRDLSVDLGKEIELKTIGEETELDKTVLDKIHDPLVHIIRNSADHGIELPAVRTKAGKSATGTITLEAKYSGAAVMIVVRDDGRGIDPDVIRKKAVQRGLIHAGEQISDEDSYQLLFAPGFSTAEAVTNLSGRGVGLDVVEKNIQSLSGSVTIQSEPGIGTSFILTLPLTLAIIDGLAVSVGTETIIIPLASVESCMEIRIDEVDTRRRLISYRESLIPYVHLARSLDIPEQDSRRKQMVVIETSHGRMGIMVDEVLGDHQTVIKSLGNMFKEQKSFSGASILGDGSIALILDINGLVSTMDTEVLEKDAAG